MGKWLKLGICCLIIALANGCSSAPKEATNEEDSIKAEGQNFFDISAQEILDSVNLAEGLELLDFKINDPIAKEETEEIIYPYYFVNSEGSISLDVAENVDGMVTNIILSTKLIAADKVLAEYPIMVEAIVLALDANIDTSHFEEVYALAEDREDILSGTEGNMQITSIQSSGYKTFMITPKGK